MNRFAFQIFSLFAAALLSGCAGYELGNVKPSVYAGIDNIHIPVFKNDTLEPRLSSLVTNAVIKEIQADGTYRVSNRGSADAVLVGRITKIDKQQLRAARTDTLKSQELSVYLYLDFRLEDPVTGEEIRSTVPQEDSPKEKQTEMDPPIYSHQGSVVGSTIQFVDASFQVGERAALSVAAEDGAKKLVSYLANGW